MKYVIQHVITPYISDLLKTDFRNNPFSLFFDGTTTSQVKKNSLTDTCDIGILIKMKCNEN